MVAVTGIAAVLGGTSAGARGVVVDASLNPSLLLFNLEPTPGSGCAGGVCSFILPYTVNFGAVTTNQIFLYSSGIVSLGAPLPASAFTSTPTDGGGNPITIPQFFATSTYNIIAPGYRPDDAGSPQSIAGQSGVTTSATITKFAQNNLSFCSPAPAPTGKTVCPTGYDPINRPADESPFIDPFITANNLGRFEGDINLKVGFEYVVFHKPSNGFVDVELFQDDQFGFDDDPLYVGTKNDLKLYDIFDAKSKTFTYRFALVDGGGGAVPEPATWLMMIGGFGLVGAAARRRGQNSVAAA